MKYQMQSVVPAQGMTLLLTVAFALAACGRSEPQQWPAPETRSVPKPLQPVVVSECRCEMPELVCPPPPKVVCPSPRPCPKATPCQDPPKARRCNRVSGETDGLSKAERLLDEIEDSYK